jgi:hypothetical protein
MSNEEIVSVTKEVKAVKEEKLFKKLENEFFKINKPEEWTLINFLKYRYVQTTLLFTNNERYEYSYYSAFVEAYKNIDIEQAKKLKTNYKVIKNCFDFHFILLLISILN